MDCKFLYFVLLVLFKVGLSMDHNACPKPRPTCTTPTKIPTPTKRVQRSSTLPASDKLCVICQRKVGLDAERGTNYKNYKLLSTQNGLPQKILSVVGREMPMPSSYICSPCENLLRQIERAVIAKDKFVKSFEEHVDKVTRTKRMANESPQRPKAKRALHLKSPTQQNVSNRNPLTLTSKENTAPSANASHRPTTTANQTQQSTQRHDEEPRPLEETYRPTQSDVSNIRNVSHDFCLFIPVLSLC